MIRLTTLFVLHFAVSIAPAAAISGGDGWQILKTSKTFSELVADTKTAIKANKMGLVTQASASDGARMQGLEIPGNRVLGVYRNDFARRMLEASVAAGIEAPIRFYVTENSDGTATLSYKTPSHVFSPYLEEGGDALRSLANELDGVFSKIFEESVR